MPSPLTIIRLRRERSSHAGRFSLLGKWIAGVVSLLVVGFLGAAFFIGLMYAQLVEDLPPVGNIEILFSNTEDGFLEPVHVYDRSKVRMFDLVHPLSVDRRWIEVGAEAETAVPENLQNAIVAYHDKSFWSNRGYDLGLLLNVILHSLGDSAETEIPKSITQRLVEMTILPSEDFLKPEIWRYLREAILAERLTERYSKEQILEWYINSIGFGHLAYGADAAALVYFDKHANELTLGECALLAASSIKPKIDLFTTPMLAKDAQGLVLQSMREEGLITELQSEKVSFEGLQLNQKSQSTNTDLQEYALMRMTQVNGIALDGRAGLHVFTTIDYDLQLQVDCATDIYLDRLQVEESDSILTMTGGMECSAARLLPPMRPGEEVAVDAILEISSVILDPREGEILSYYGSASKPTPSTTILYPFVYLTAFTRGSSPGTMVLDIPIDDSGMDRFEQAIAHGPVSIRTALVGGYSLANQRVIQSNGVDAITKVLEQMGVANPTFNKNVQIDELFPERYEVSLLDTVFGYGVLANSGRMRGVLNTPPASTGERSVDPILIEKVLDDDGSILYVADQGERLILSQELAFLTTHVLKDTATRWSLFGQSNLFEFNRPTAVMNGSDLRGDLSWAVGYTPSRVVGVWLDQPLDDANENSIDHIRALSLWHALMEFITENLPAESWEAPPGILEVDICVPSGLLPTEFCPKVVEELFLEGTEPIHYDTLYKPFQVNKETGKLTTLSTPLDQVQEEIFFVAPAEAVEWAREAGYPQPPNEYDSLDITPAKADVIIDIPRSFDIIRGKKWVSGRMNVDNFRYFRLVYGKGLNPTHWYQIGEDNYKPVIEGTLALWDTRDLDGLYTLQLMVVDQDGVAHIATQYVTIDNQPPDIILLCTQGADPIHLDKGQSCTCESDVSDNMGISKVEFYFQGKRIGTDFNFPFSVTVYPDALGESELVARAYDLAGNLSESESVRILVVE
jgi:membrane peptidoglycan carboxypeptidase